MGFGNPQQGGGSVAGAGASSIAIDSTATAAGANSVVVGVSGVGGSGTDKVVIGKGAVGGTTGTNNVIIGKGAAQNAATSDGVAIGDSSGSGTQSVAIGSQALAQFNNGVAIGKSATATANQGTAVGTFAIAAADGQVTIGYGSIGGTGTGAIAIGRQAVTTDGATDSIAIGRTATTGAFTNCLVLGQGATGTANNDGQIGTVAQPFNLRTYGTLRQNMQALTAGTMTGATASTALNQTVVHAFTWTNAMVVALGGVTAGDIAVCTLPAKTIVKNAYIVINTAAAGVTTLTVAVGRTSATYIDYIVASDARAAANTVYGDASGERGTNLTGYDLPSFTGTTVVNAHFVSTGANLSATTTSTGTIYLETMILP